MVNESVSVSIVFAEPTSQWRVDLSLPAGSTVASAVAASRFPRHFPNYPLDALKVGIYGQQCELDRTLKQGDRIEIYRNLNFDPMESRRRRAEHRKAFMIKPRNTPRRRKTQNTAAPTSDS